MPEPMETLDAVTGIRSRSSMDPLLESAWHRCRNERLPFTLMLIDLDCFGNYNDCYGLHAGNETLKEIASCIAGAVGVEGLIGRYGGDEFLVALANVRCEKAEVIGNRMLTNVRERGIKHERNDASDMQTVTIGAVSLVPGKEDTLSAVLKMAQTAFYEGERNGKDRLVLYCRE